MIEDIKALRKGINSLYNITNDLLTKNTQEGLSGWGSWIKSNEITNTCNSLLIANSWLGELLKKLGELNISIDTNKLYWVRVENNNIELMKVENWEQESNNPNISIVEKLIHIHECIDTFVSHLQKLLPNLVTLENYALILSIIIKSIYTNLTEAKFYIKFELKRHK